MRGDEGCRAWPCHNIILFACDIITAPSDHPNRRNMLATSLAEIVTTWSAKSLRDDVLRFEIGGLQQSPRDWRRWSTHCLKDKLVVYRGDEKHNRNFFVTPQAPTAACSSTEATSAREPARVPEQELLRRLQEVIV